LLLLIAVVTAMFVSLPHNLDSPFWCLPVFMYPDFQIPHLYRLVFLLSGLALLSLLVPCVPLIRPRLRWLPTLCAIIVGFGCAWLTIIYHRAAIEALNPSLAFPIVILSQIYATAITRRVLRLSAKAKRFSYIIILLLINLLGIALLVFIPGTLYFKTGVHILMMSAVLNLSSGILLSTFFCLGCIMLVHHFVWPSLLRPMYSLQRLKLLRHKRTLVCVGLVCIIASLSNKTPFVAIKDMVMRYISR
jgi:hypothetical protein